MPASSARIAFVRQQYRTAVAEDEDVKTAYGESARDSSDDDGEPIETFFDSVADAQAMADERLALLSADRRRFRQDVDEVLSFTGDLDFSQVTPAVTVIDDERSADHPAAAVEIAVRFGDDRTTIISWG